MCLRQRTCCCWRRLRRSSKSGSADSLRRSLKSLQAPSGATAHPHASLLKSKPASRWGELAVSYRPGKPGNQENISHKFSSVMKWWNCEEIQLHKPSSCLFPLVIFLTQALFHILLTVFKARKVTLYLQIRSYVSMACKSWQASWSHLMLSSIILFSLALNFYINIIIIVWMLLFLFSIKCGAGHAVQLCMTHTGLCKTAWSPQHPLQAGRNTSTTRVMSFCPFSTTSLPRVKPALGPCGTWSSLPWHWSANGARSSATKTTWTRKRRFLRRVTPPDSTPSLPLGEN